MKRITHCIVIAAMTHFCAFYSITAAQQTPPGLDEETAGEPAEVIIEKQTEQSENAQESTRLPSLLGESEVTELRRQSGQVYRIELKHASGSRQVVEETDSDGVIETTPNDLEETPNLPKWRIGSW